MILLLLFVFLIICADLINENKEKNRQHEKEMQELKNEQIDLNNNKELKRYMKTLKKCNEALPSAHDLFHDLFTTCPICGNKRCPKAENDKFKCTDSNELDQIGELEDE